MVCTECGKTYNDKMAVCPFCGAKKDDVTELEIIDLDDILELDDAQDTSDEVIELDIVENEDGRTGNEGKEYKSFSDIEDLNDYQRVEIKLQRREYKENQIMLDSDDIMYYLKSDKRRIKTIICLFIALAGSFFNFWGIATDAVGNIKMGSLFAGYGLGGILGKICVLLILGAIVLTVLNLTRYGLFATAASFFTMFVQAVVSFISSITPEFEYAMVMKFFYPDLGFFIMALFMLAAVVFLSQSPERAAKKAKEAKEKEIQPEELLKEAIAQQQEDIQRQKEKLQQKEDKRAAKEISKAEKKVRKKKSKESKEEVEILELEAEEPEEEEELQFEEINDDIKVEAKRKSKKQKKR